MSLIDPLTLQQDTAKLEQVERASIRYVAYAVNNMAETAKEQFDAMRAVTPDIALTKDAADYLGEDLTRMALEQIGASAVPGGRLFGAVDYKAAVLQFLPEFAIEQALLVDSKAEKEANTVCRVQTTQTSLEIRQRLTNGSAIAVQGLVPPVWESGAHRYLPTTLFVKYHYSDAVGLKSITVAALPHVYLQETYNPSADDNIWNIGPNSPARGEAFRTRLNFNKLAAKASWRVQKMVPGNPWSFQE